MSVSTMVSRLLLFTALIGCGDKAKPEAGGSGPAESGSPSSVATAPAAPDTESPPLPEPKLIPIGDELPVANVQVSLPPRPAFDPAKVPERFADGAYSVAGVRARPDALLTDGAADRSIEVRAWVQAIHVPPVGCIGPSTSCRQAHVWVGDSPDMRGRRNGLLVGPILFEIPEAEREHWADQPQVELELGKQYTFEGKFVRVSETGFTDARGLLQFTRYRSDNTSGEWVIPPGAPWHPLQRADEAAAEQAMLERLGKD